MKRIFTILNGLASGFLLAALVLTGRAAAGDFQSNSITAGGGNVVFSRTATDASGNIYVNIIFYMKTIRLGFVPSAKPAATPATPKL